MFASIQGGAAGAHRHKAFFPATSMGYRLFAAVGPGAFCPLT